MRASDGGEPARHATARVSASVLGAPADSSGAPQFSEDNSRRADVMESDPVGHAVAFISATDPDGDLLWYNIEGEPLLLFLCFKVFLFFQWQLELDHVYLL